MSTNPRTGGPYSQRYYEILETRKKLPVWEKQDEFLQALKNNQILIFVGEPGYGKTTQIPQFALESGSIIEEVDRHKIIACTQPRGVAAISASHRAADGMDVSLGEEVGYSVRFENCSGPKTILKLIDIAPNYYVHGYLFSCETNRALEGP